MNRDDKNSFLTALNGLLKMGVQLGVIKHSQWAKIDCFVREQMKCVDEIEESFKTPVYKPKPTKVKLQGCSIHNEELINIPDLLENE